MCPAWSLLQLPLLPLLPLLSRHRRPACPAAAAGAARACVWWSTQCALVRMRRPSIMKPLLLLLYCRLRCHGRLKLGSVWMQNTWQQGGWKGAQAVVAGDATSPERMPSVCCCCCPCCRWPHLDDRLHDGVAVRGEVAARLQEAAAAGGRVLLLLHRCRILRRGRACALPTPTTPGTLRLLLLGLRVAAGALGPARWRRRSLLLVQRLRRALLLLDSNIVRYRILLDLLARPHAAAFACCCSGADAFVCSGCLQHAESPRACPALSGECLSAYATC